MTSLKSTHEAVQTLDHLDSYSRKRKILDAWIGAVAAQGQADEARVVKTITQATGWPDDFARSYLTARLTVEMTGEPSTPRRDYTVFVSSSGVVLAQKPKKTLDESRSVP